MTTSHSGLKSGIHVVAFLALAVMAGLAAAPASAQPDALTSFSLKVGHAEERGVSQGTGTPGDQGSAARASEAGTSGPCLVDSGIRDGLGDYGFGDVEFRRSLGPNRVEVHAVLGSWIYGMQVDRCTGSVDRVERIRRAMGGGFGLHFEYGGGY